MKNKSVRHKELNTFKFQPFSERISNIDIDIFHKVGHEYETDTDDKQCYFYQTVENWSTLNLTESFDEFKREIKPNNLITLPQLILEQEHVIQVLLKHLKLKNPLNLQPLLEILVALVKDLRKDFYPYYKEFLQVLIDLLNTKNTEQLEWVFFCLAYIFKYLWRPLLKDITTVFDSLLPLLSNTRPEYINNFAAESFAFVARKIKDHNNFLSLVLKTVKNRNDGIEGCGKLFFEIIHGIDGNFHSCAETVLPLWLESLSNKNLPNDTLFEILEKVVENIVNNIVPDRSELLFNSLIQRLDCLLDNWQNNNDTNIANDIEFILKLLGQSIEYRNGKLLQNPTIIMEQMLKFFNNNNLPETILIIGVQISVILLQSKKIRLNQEQTCEIVRRILNLNHEPVLLYFIDNITSFSSFEYLILPQFLKYCLKTNLNHNCFNVLTKLILKKSKLCNNGIDLLDWKKYTIDLNNLEYNVIIEKIMVEFIKKFNNYDDENLTNYISSTICLPHLNLSCVDEIEQYLIENYLKLLKILEEDCSNHNKKVKLLFLFNITIECLIHLNKLDSLTKHFQDILETLLPLSINKDYLVALNGIDLLITALRDHDEIIKLENLEKIDGVLRQNFSSPYHEVRLVTAHLYTFFENLQYFNINHSNDPDVPKENWSVFTICYRVESIDSHVHTYRDQLQNLEKFNTNKPQILMCKQTKFKTLPLQYLCGCLYINFKLLWEPILSIIKQHANNLQIDEFWLIYNRELRNVVDYIKQQQHKEYKLDSLNIEPFLNQLYENQQKLTNKPDFYNYRSLLWRAMLQFPEIAESRTRDVSEIFLNFINDEFRNYHTDTTLVLNIKQKETNIDDNNEDDDDDDDDNNEKLERRIQNTRRNRDLLDFLQVFSRVQSPKSMYRESELNKLYFDLLQHKNPAIQKAALDCLMTYKYKYLIPYKEHLYNLIDDKNFRKELTTFHLHQNNSFIINEHRNNLIPIILKIVFSKMIGKLGLRTGGKSSGYIKRNLILRFLSGCKDNELFSFLQMTFRYYLQYFNDDYDIMINEIVNNIDLERFIPPKRLQSTVNLLEIILEQCSNLLNDELLTFIIKIMLVIGAKIYGVLQQIDKVYIGYLQQLRNLRTSSIKIIEFIFKQFDRYLWTNQQIDAIFRVFVWPYLNQLNTEGIHNPTSLLKLFAQFGTNPRYFQLLAKHENGNKENFILPKIIELFVNDKSNITVINLIEEIIEKLLSLVVGEDTQQLVLEGIVPIQENILERLKIDDKLNYGSCILLPYIPMILKRIQKKLETKHKNLNQKELFILTRISELVWESDISNDILKLLLPILIKRSQCSEEIILQYLTTINNLLENSDEPRLHLKDISILFGEISCVSGRKLLVKILKKTIKNCEIIENLNAWDQKWIEQPDFTKRHDTFKLIDKLIDTKAIDLDQSILIIYNCYYFLKNDKDLSVHENSLYCLKKLCTYLIKQYHNTKDFDYIVNDTILRLIHRGICYKKDDDFRNDSILLLGHLARECDSYHPVLYDLNKFTNKNDLEVDMFENLTHLQLYRHTKALLRFYQITKESTNNFNLRTITQFLLPLITHYLCSEKYLNKNSIIDGSIDAISIIARILPWYQYEKLLKFYLSELRKKVDYQKQLVRVNVAILDSFHFDLSKGYLIEQNIEDKHEEIIEIPNEDDVEDGESNEIFKEIDEEDGEEEIIEVEQEKVVKICEKTTILCKSTAIRVIRTIQTILLPQLYKSLGEMTQHDLSHRLNKKRFNYEKEEEDLLRVPLSLALVKLLQRLPNELMEQNLPGIFMKLCTFLKSHMESVRRVTRETLQKIMQTLGPDYLDVLLKEMTTLLNRGYQVHVLVYTTHSILQCLRDVYKPYHIDKILLTVVNLCQMDLFGALSDEKDVVKITAKTSEAKSTKSYDTLQILAQYTTDKCLLDLIMPIKNVLQSTNSYKIANKISESFRYITLGLVDNSFITIETLLKFAYGIVSESIPELFVNKKLKQQEKQQKLPYEKEDCFIIPKEIVTRSGVRQNNVKTSTEMNAHLLIEFGLRICYILLKRDKLTYEHREFLDPYIKIYKNCLKSPHIKLSTIALNCLGWCMKLDLPSIQQHITPITKDIFTILHKYASAGLNNKGDNFDLVMAAFKTMAIIVRDLKYHTITMNQLKILLLYVEQDIHNTNRQVVAFNLLKAIILRKLICDEIHDVMNKISELSIVSELDHIRVQARNVFHQYLMDYPLGDRLTKYVSFYLSQMSYEMQYGRESAIEMIQTLINTFPLNVLKKQSGTLLVTLGARLVNDDVPECRKMVAKCLSSMLVRLNKTDRDPLFDVTLLWFKDKNLNHRRLAAQICGIFVSVEKSSFETRSPQLYPMILHQLSIKIDKDVNEDYERIRDHYLFQFLQMLLKICTHCPAFFKDNQENFDDLAKYVQSLLSYPHDWVRLAAAQFIGFILSKIDIDKLSTLLLQTNNDEDYKGYLYKDPLKSVKSLILDLCDQLQPGAIKNDLAEQVIKNLVFMARVLQTIPITIGRNNDNKINLLWLTKLLRRIINNEIVEASNQTVLRMEIFKWIAAIGTILDLNMIQSILNHLLAPLVREMITTEESNAPLRQLSKEVGNLLKKRVGIEIYTKTLSNLQQNLSGRRNERKRNRAQLAVTDPDLYAQKKIKHHEKKKIAKKRKLMDRKGVKKVFKKRKIIDLDPTAEVFDCYDPSDPEVSSVIPPKGLFEAFYPRGDDGGSSRAAHSHGSFYKYRNPALVDAKNAAAYGFRFDGGRRFNYE